MKPPSIGRLALVLSLLAFLSTAWAAYHVFEGLPHVEDEYAFLWQASVMAEGKAALPSPQEPSAFLVPFVVDLHGSRFAKYPPGWSAALSLGVRAGAPWLVNPVLAGLSIWLLFRLASKVSRPSIGLLAALLAACSPMFIMLSGSLMSHAWSLFLSSAFALAWLDLFPGGRKDQKPTRRLPAGLLIAVAGLSIGMLGLTRPLTAVAIGVPFGLHGLILLLSGRQPFRKHLLATAGLALMVLSLLPLWQWALTGSPWLNPYTLWWPYDRIGFGPGIGPMPGGHSLFLARNNTQFSLRSGLHDLFGWPYLSWIFIPFGLWKLRRNRGAMITMATFPSLVLTYMAYWIGSWLFGPRYYYEALPGLALASAAGVAWLGNWSAAGGALLRARRLILVAILAILFAADLCFYIPARVGGMHGLYGVSRSSIEPFQNTNLSPALIFVHPERGWKEYGALVTLGPPFSHRRLIMAYARTDEINLHVMHSHPGFTVYHYFPADPYRLFKAMP